MRKYILPFIVMVLFLFCYSCTKDRTTVPVPAACTTVNAKTNTYTLNIQNILANNCAYSGCHDGSVPLSSVDNVYLASYSGTVSAFKTQNALCSIEQDGCTPMPNGYPKLADSLITYFVCWSENGYTQ